MAAAALDSHVDAAAFRRIYPSDFLDRFLAEKVRPDGRPIGRARPMTFALGTIPSANGSATMKIGNTAMLAGVKLEVFRPTTAEPDKGTVMLSFELPPICSSSIRPGRQNEIASSCIQEQLISAMDSIHFIDTTQLCIAPGHAAWALFLDVYCLEADGSLLDAALLASALALKDVQLPSVQVGADGRVYPSLERGGAFPPAANRRNREGGNRTWSEKGSPWQQQQHLVLGKVPLGLTCALYKTHLLVDPTAEEEAVAASCLLTVVMAEDEIISVYKPGGAVRVSSALLQDCFAAVRARAEELQLALNTTTA